MTLEIEYVDVLDVDGSWYERVPCYIDRDRDEITFPAEAAERLGLEFIDVNFGEGEVPVPYLMDGVPAAVVPADDDGQEMYTCDLDKLVIRPAARGGWGRPVPGHEHCPGCINCGRGLSNR